MFLYPICQEENAVPVIFIQKGHFYKKTAALRARRFAGIVTAIVTGRSGPSAGSSMLAPIRTDPSFSEPRRNCS